MHLKSAVRHLILAVLHAHMKLYSLPVSYASPSYQPIYLSSSLFPSFINQSYQSVNFLNGINVYPPSICQPVYTLLPFLVSICPMNMSISLHVLNTHLHAYSLPVSICPINLSACLHATSLPLSICHIRHTLNITSFVDTGVEV